MHIIIYGIIGAIFGYFEDFLIKKQNDTLDMVLISILNVSTMLFVEILVWLFIFDGWQSIKDMV